MEDRETITAFRLQPFRKGVGFWCFDPRKPTRRLVLKGFAVGRFFFNKKAADPILIRMRSKPPTPLWNG
jgi:hypothetical protein